MINVIGLGYIGLPTALMLAASGHAVVGTDINTDIVNKLNDGVITFEEDGLDELFSEAVRKKIEFSPEYQKADIYIVTVPTPYDKNLRKIEPYYIINAVETVISMCESGAIIVIESTISPGTIDKHIRPVIIEKGLAPGKDVHLVHAPERIIPGKMIHELRYNSRTIGADNWEIGEKIRTIYSTFCVGEIIVTDIKTAEMTKVVENTYRDINIAFANELAKICRSDEMDVYEIIRIANMHPRVNIMQPGPGVGGHCISVDPWFLVGDYPGLANIVLAARKINDSMPQYVLNRIYEIMQENGITDASKVGLYGLTYKENINDIRESPTLQLLEAQRRHLANELKVYDPLIMTNIVSNQYFDLDEFLAEVEMVVIMVAHDEVKENMFKLGSKIVLDTRSIYRSENIYML